MREPSVIGRLLGEAERMLREAEAPVASIVRTSPPGTPPAGPLRVVRQREVARPRQSRGRHGGPKGPSHPPCTGRTLLRSGGRGSAGGLLGLSK